MGSRLDREVNRLITLFHNHAELTRVSNLPTVFSNAMVGCAAAAAGLEVPFPWKNFWISALGLGLIYLAGMAMNDLFDVEFDRNHRPDRPIPSGRISPRSAWGLVVLFLVTGNVLLFRNGCFPLLCGLGLTGLVALYNFFHKKHSGTVILMGMCRGMVVLAASFSVRNGNPSPLTIWFMFLIGLYTVCLTGMARRETSVSMGSAGPSAVLLPIIVLASALPAAPVEAGPTVLFLGFLVVGWFGRVILNVFSRPPQTMQAVLGALSGFSLADAFYLSLLNRGSATMAALLCFIATAWGHRRIRGT